MKNNSGAEFATVQDGEIKVFDLSELENCILPLIDQYSDVGLDVRKYNKDKPIYPGCIYINIYNLARAKESFPVTDIVELPYLRIINSKGMLKDKFVNPFNLASILVNNCDFRRGAFYPTIKYYKGFIEFYDWYSEYKRYFPATAIKRLYSDCEDCGFMGTSWNTFNVLCQHLDMTYLELCKAIHEGQSLDGICMDRLCKKTYGNNVWHSWLEFAKDYTSGKYYYYGISNDYEKILQEFKSANEISLIKKPEFRFNYVPESKIPDSIIATVSIAGIHYLSRDKQIEKIKEAKSVLDSEVVEALKKNKTFQKLNIPVNYLKVTRKTYTQAEELVYYFGWKEIPKNVAQS